MMAFTCSHMPRIFRSSAPGLGRHHARPVAQRALSTVLDEKKCERTELEQWTVIQDLASLDKARLRSMKLSKKKDEVRKPPHAYIDADGRGEPPSPSPPRLIRSRPHSRFSGPPRAASYDEPDDGENDESGRGNRPPNYRDHREMEATVGSRPSTSRLESTIDERGERTRREGGDPQRVRRRRKAQGRRVQ